MDDSGFANVSDALDCSEDNNNEVNHTDMMNETGNDSGIGNNTNTLDTSEESQNESSEDNNQVYNTEWDVI